MTAKNQQKCSILAVSGIKNSGKTTFLTRILPLLAEKGVRTAVIKHDGHTFEPDVEGTDSFRLRKAGAEGIAVYCDTHYMIIEKRSQTWETLIKKFSDMNLILIEGGKYTSLPKIEIVRKNCSEYMICDKESILAVATDSLKNFGVRKIELNDYEAAVSLILDYMKKNSF